MKILIVSRSFYPGNWPRAFRTTELAKEFSRQEHDVTVITHEKPEQKKIIDKYGIKIIDLGNKKWNTLSLNSKSVFVQKILRVINKLTYWLFEYPNIELTFMISRILKNESGYDLLISIAHPYPVHWGVALATRKKKIAKTWVADCGDPYFNQENASLRPPFYFKFIDDWFMSRADHITIPIEQALKAYNQKYHNKFRIIPQGFKLDEIRLYDGNLRSDKVVFGYAGMFIPGKRDPNQFLTFLNELDDSYLFEFHIWTHSPHLIQPFVKKSNGRIVLHNIVPREEVLYELSKMHFLVNFANQGTVQSPSKLIDYAILNKPVLSIKHEQLSEKSVMEFLVGNYSSAMQLPNIENYRIESIAQSFLDLASD